MSLPSCLHLEVCGDSGGQTSEICTPPTDTIRPSRAPSPLEILLVELPVTAGSVEILPAVVSLTFLVCTGIRCGSNN